MRVLITSGIFAPEPGGPATYAPQLATELTKLGHKVSVLTLSSKSYFDSDAAYPFSLRRIPRAGKLLNRIKFFFAAYRAMRTCDIVYTLDWFAVGLPVAIAAKMRRVPYVVRVGGDYLWEQQYLESGEPSVTLREFYKRGLHKSATYAPFLSFIRFVLAGARTVIFNSDEQRQIYEKYYELTRTTTIENPIPKIDGVKRESSNREFVYWGRLIEMKNVKTLLRAFAAATVPGYTLAIIGDGPQKSMLQEYARELGITSRVAFEPSMPRGAVLERVKNARAFILPSWTDISPNQVYEALALGLPALVTKENYLGIRSQLPDQFDPHSVDDLAPKLEMLDDDAKYADFARKFSAITLSNDWHAVTQAHVQLFEKVLESREFRVLQIGADRSKRGILYPGSPAFERQQAYAKELGKLDIIGFSRSADAVQRYSDKHLTVTPTNSSSALWYGLDAIRIARKLPRPLIVSVQDPFETGLVAWWIARKYRVSLHVQIHTDFLSPEYAKRPIDHVRRLIARFVLSRTTRVRVVSDRIKDSIQACFHITAPVSVLPIYVDIEKFKNAAPSPDLAQKFAAFKTKLLVVSRLEAEKNVALAVETFAKAAPQDSCLIIVGGGSERRTLEFLADDLKVGNRVFFEGERPSIEYYPISDLVLVTSRYEGYGLVIIEALAAGKPVLSTDVGIAREAGAIVTEPEDFAHALKAWLEKGSRVGELKAYPYKDFVEYVRAYCDDIVSCVSGRKSQ